MANEHLTPEQRELAEAAAKHQAKQRKNKVRRLGGIAKGDIRELVLQRCSTDAAHDSESRPTPSQIAASYDLDCRLLQPPPQTILIVDDVLTTGAHFVAMKSILAPAFPDAKLVGLFIARRVPETSDFEEFFGE